MFEVFKLYLQGYSGYKIARKLNLDPPAVYAALESAKHNFAEADKMLTHLKALGWPLKLPEVEEQIRSKNPHKKKAVANTETEIAIRIG